MQPAVTLTMASVGAVIVRVGNVGEADVAGGMDGGGTHAGILAPRARHAPRRARRAVVASISYLRYRGRHD